MKKTISLLLALSLVLALAGCGAKLPIPPKETTEAAQTTEAPETTVPETTEATETTAPQETEAPKEKKLPAFSHEGQIQETVLLEESGAKITALSLGYSGSAVTLYLQLENTGKQTLTFSCNSEKYGCNAINGYMVGSGLLERELAPGESARDALTFPIADLQLLGIHEIADICLGFQITAGYQDAYTGPLQVKTNLADSYDYSRSSFQKTIQDPGLYGSYGLTLESFTAFEPEEGEKISLISTAAVTNRQGGLNLLVEVQNNTEEPLAAIVGNLSLNNLVVSASSVAGGVINPGSRMMVPVIPREIPAPDLLKDLKLEDPSSAGLVLQSLDGQANLLDDPVSISIELSGKSKGWNREGLVVYEDPQVRILYEGTAKEKDTILDDMVVIYLVENLTEGPMGFSGTKQGCLINGQKLDCSSQPLMLAKDQGGLLLIGLPSYKLNMIGLTDPEQIESLEVPMLVISETGSSRVVETVLDETTAE